MKIEPCLYCGAEMVALDNGSFCCPSCVHLVESGNVQAYNRLSRIVRAAEDWVREEKIPGNLSKIQDAEEALRNAVEGGRADG